jgi:V8-like Glu-specific endopeptidase
MMRAHAVVIGIDHYPANPHWDLKGATRDAVNFAGWVTKYGGVAASDLTLLLSPQPGQVPAGPAFGKPDRRTINDTLDAYLDRKARGTDRFWFYYAGHGLAPTGAGPSEGPLMVPMDTHSLKHDAIAMELFRQAMQDIEPKEQLYFIDACRDVLDVNASKTFTQRLYWDPRDINDNKLATQVVFLATTVGKKAKELRGQGIFSRVLLTALNGMGPRLEEPSDSSAGRVSLYFNSLNTFVRDVVGTELADVEGLDSDERSENVPYATIGRVIRDVEIAQFDVQALPKAKITAVVRPRPALPAGRLEFVEWSSAAAGNVPVADPAPVEPLLKEKHTFELRGGTYKVRVKAPGYKEKTWPLLVYRDKSFLLELAPAAEGLEAVVPPPPDPRPLNSCIVNVHAVDRLTRLSVVDGSGEIRARGFGYLSQTLPAGSYLVRGELAGVPSKEETIVVQPGDTADVSIDIAPGTYVDPSENLGQIANAKLSSMLAFAAWAARWPEADGFHRLRRLGIDPLPQLNENGTAVQVLIGDAMNDPAFLAQCLVTRQHRDTDPFEPLALAPMALLPIIDAHALQGASVEQGTSVRVRVEMPGFVPTTFPLTLLPRLITVMVVTREKNGNVEVQLHFNPIDPKKPVAPGFEAPRLDDVRIVDLGARALENREPLGDNEYARLVGAKGTNPMLGVIAGYRTVGTEHAPRFSGEPLDNLLAGFPGLPDVHVVAALHRPRERDAHFKRTMEAGTPVFAEGFWALVDWLTEEAGRKNLAPPLLREQLTSGMVWTSFLDAAAGEKGTVRLVTTSGRTSLATITDDRSVMVAARSAGRVASGGGSYLSTAFLIAPRIAVVPVHVATAFASVDADGVWRIEKPTSISFDLADPQSTRQVVDILRTVRPGTEADGGSLAPQMLDICWPVLLRLDADAPVPALSIATQPVAEGDRVSVIGFPIDTGTPATSEFAHLFTASSGEKHVMPGTVERAAGATWTFDHNCFTAPGTSGGPVVNRAGEVVGMHVAGRASTEGLKAGFKSGTAIALTRFEPDAFE